jgi:hypothetical protein
MMPPWFAYVTRARREFDGRVVAVELRRIERAHECQDVLAEHLSGHEDREARPVRVTNDADTICCPAVTRSATSSACGYSRMLSS